MKKKNLPEICECPLCIYERVQYIANGAANQILQEKVSEGESFMELSKEQVEFFQYYIKKYHDHFDKGELDDAYHCAVAVLLVLENGMVMEEDNRCEKASWCNDHVCPTPQDNTFDFTAITKQMKLNAKILMEEMTQHAQKENEKSALEVHLLQTRVSYLESSLDKMIGK